MNVDNKCKNIVEIEPNFMAGAAGPARKGPMLVEERPSGKKR